MKIIQKVQPEIEGFEILLLFRAFMTDTDLERKGEYG